MDAPFHFFGDRTTIDRVPLERTHRAGAAGATAAGQAIGRTIEPSTWPPYDERLRRARRVVFNTALASSLGRGRIISPSIR